MKKFFTLLLLCGVLSGVALAQSFVGVLNVNIEGIDADPKPATVTLTATGEGLCHFYLPNFMFVMAGDPMYVGDINVPNVAAIPQVGHEVYGDFTYLYSQGEDNILLSEGNDPNALVWVATELPVVGGTIEGGVLPSGQMLIDITLFVTGLNVHAHFEGQAQGEGIATLRAEADVAQACDLMGRPVTVARGLVVRQGQVQLVR